MACNRARELRHFERVRQACAKEIPFVVQEHLCLVDQPAKGSAVHDPVAVTLIGRAVFL
jgi:hypothetical protein